MLDSLQTWLACDVAKAAAFASKTLKRGSGTSLPGKLALTVQPRLLPALANSIEGPIVAVTGTNGKTTTCGLLAAFHRQAGQRVIHNQLGANMLSGIATALSLQSNGMGQLKADQVVLEIDEASLAGIACQVPLNALAVTNLFRDQLDRYGELDTTAQLISSAFISVKETIWLNADDPLVARLAQQAETAGKTVRFFGVRSFPANRAPLHDHGVPFPKEVTACPSCGATLEYGQTFYSHLGHYDCPACAFKRPELDLEAEVLELSPTESHLRVTGLMLPAPLELRTTLPGRYNLYNVLAALALAFEGEVLPDAIQPALDSYEAVFGRAEQREVDGKPISILLIKNPTGAAEALQLVANDPTARVLVAINDNYADGRDVSWLWDAPFEVLSEISRQIIVSGVRAHDMANRLHYAGVPSHQLTSHPSLKEALHLSIQTTEPGERLYILPTYTALLELTTLWEAL